MNSLSAPSPAAQSNPADAVDVITTDVAGLGETLPAVLDATTLKTSVGSALGSSGLTANLAIRGAPTIIANHLLEIVILPAAPGAAAVNMTSVLQDVVATVPAVVVQHMRQQISDPPTPTSTATANSPSPSPAPSAPKDLQSTLQSAARPGAALARMMVQALIVLITVMTLAVSGQ